MYKYTFAAGRTYVLNGPGAIVKKITIEKSLKKVLTDFLKCVIITLSRERKNFQEKN